MLWDGGIDDIVVGYTCVTVNFNQVVKYWFSMNKNWHHGHKITQPTDIPYQPNNRSLMMTRGYVAEILYLL